MVAQDVEKLKQAFGDNAFSGKDVAKVLNMDARGTGGIFKYMLLRRQVRKVRSGIYQFVRKEVSAPIQAIPETAPVVASELVCSRPTVVRIGDLYLAERMLLITSTAFQEASPALRIYTTVIEVDPATKHPRNKVLNFIKARDPREYAQAMAWLDSLAGVPTPAVDETALELAAELEGKLSAANKEIAELQAKLDAIRGAL